MIIMLDTPLNCKVTCNLMKKTGGFVAEFKEVARTSNTLTTKKQSNVENTMCRSVRPTG